jgi:hypothetical protein
MDNIEQKKVTYEHEVDSMHETKKTLERGKSVTPNSSLTEAVDEVGNPGRLNIQYNIGKRPETRNV